MRTKLTGGIATLILASVAMTAPAAAAPDNLLQAWSDPMRLVHMYTAANGSTQIDELTLPARDQGGTGDDALVRTFIEGAATRVRLLSYKPGFQSPWHYARERAVTDDAKVVLVLTGELVVTLGEGRTFRAPAGTLMYNDDHAGQGHRTRCEASGKATGCLLIDIELADGARLFDLPKR